jgi:predicted membrane protein
MKHRNWFWGIFLLAAAVFIIVGQTVTFVTVGFWSIAATVLLTAVFISSLADLSFFGIFISAALLYEIYQGPFRWPAVNIWIILLAAVLASSGCDMIFHSHRHHWREDWRGCDGAECEGRFSENLEGNDISAKNSFSESCKYLHSDCLRSAHLASSFGKMSVYFDQVRVSPEGAMVDVSVSFGKTTLYIPGNWRVVDRLHASFGSVTNRMRSEPLPPDAPVLTLNGEVSFGELELRSV